MGGEANIRPAAIAATTILTGPVFRILRESCDTFPDMVLGTFITSR